MLPFCGRDINTPGKAVNRIVLEICSAIRLRLAPQPSLPSRNPTRRLQNSVAAKVLRRVSCSELLAPWKRRELSSPSPQPSPQRRGRGQARRLQSVRARRLVARPAWLPLPWGEGRGEGELGSRRCHGASRSEHDTHQTRFRFLAAWGILVRWWAFGLTITQRRTRMSALQSPVPTPLEKCELRTSVHREGAGE